MGENKNNEIPDWPIDPTFLSLRKGIDNKYSASPNNDGFFYSNELRGILADASATLWGDETDIEEGQIFALFQVVPENIDFDTKDNKGAWFVELRDVENDMITGILEERKIIRIHPGSLYPNLKCCELFRGGKYKDDNGCEQSCKNKCFEMDSRIALLYDPKIKTSKKDENHRIIWKDFHAQLKEVVGDKEGTYGYNKKLKDEYEKGKYKEDIEDVAPYLLIIKEDKGKRPYVGYSCIYSGLMEYFFPIMYSDRVIAVLMLGQCAPEELKSEVMYKKYRRDNPKLSEYIENKQRQDDNFKVDYNENKKKMLFNHPKGHEPISDTQLDAISDLIKKIEERVENEVKARYKEYVSDKFFKIEKAFRKKVGIEASISGNSSEKFEDLRKEIANLDRILQNYKERLGSTLKDIVDQFDPNGFIRIFAIESPIANQINPQKDGFNLIGDSKQNRNPPYSKIIFNRIKKRFGTINKDELLDDRDEKLNERGHKEPYFPERYREKYANEFKDNDIFRVEFSFSTQIAYLIWERYDYLDIKSTQYTEYRAYLDLMYHTLLEPYIIIERIRLEKDLEATMRVSSHESAQIIPVVSDIISCLKTLKPINKKKSERTALVSSDENIQEQKVVEAIRYLKEASNLNSTEDIYVGSNGIIPEKVITDASRRLSLLDALFKRLSRIFKEGKPKLGYSDFHRIVYAPESLYQEKAKLNNRLIKIYCDPDLDHYSLKTNYGDISHILFNLIDNAIKYGLKGSNIWINAQLHYEGYMIFDSHRVVPHFKEITISVISYGNKIEEDDSERIFELYFRSKDTKGTQGMGIGLFLVKKLCNHLEYKIKCTSEQIEEYNVPLKHNYCNQNKRFAESTSLSLKTIQTLKEESKPSHNEIIYTKVEDWNITAHDLEWGPKPKLFKPTYKNEFKITIPIEKDYLKRTNFLKYGKNIID